MWCVPEINHAYVKRMEDVLRLYARPYDPLEPVVCLDERPVALRGSARRGRRGRPGKVARTDYEYVRRGTANVFCIVEPKLGRRMTHATKNRAGPAYATALKRIARRYPGASRIHLVQDNLSTHARKPVVDALGQADGRRLWRRFRVHYTPKHGSWLNMAEIEVSLVSRECLGQRRISDLHTLQREVAHWKQRAEQQRRTIAWKFTVRDARRKFRYNVITTLGSKD